MTDLARYLHTIAGGDDTALIEVRYSSKLGMRQLWAYAGGDELHRHIIEQGQQTDTYVGVAPRTHQAGGKAAVNVAHVLWVDADSPESVERLQAFPHPPTMTVASGTPGRLHGYWSLSRPLSKGWVERANRRLCHALGADPQCAEVARILRPPGTLNFKGPEPMPVELVEHTGRRYTSAQLVASLPDPPTRTAPDFEPRDPDPNDTLASISPRVYFPRLTGREVGRNGKAQCPFHGGGQERTPSLHVYEDPAKGWHCFGCGIGGSIYDLGAALWDLPTRGGGFKELRDRLARELGVTT